MAKTKKEELIEGVDAPSVDPVVTEDATEVVTIETVAKSLLDEAEAEIERLKAVITDSEEEKEDLKELLKQAQEKIEALQGGPVVIAEKAEPLSFEFEGEKYQFSAKAPALILINGTGVSQQEIIEDEELVLQLIGGNGGLILKK